MIQFQINISREPNELF